MQTKVPYRVLFATESHDSVWIVQRITDESSVAAESHDCLIPSEEAAGGVHVLYLDICEHAA